MSRGKILGWILCLVLVPSGVPAQGNPPVDPLTGVEFPSSLGGLAFARTTLAGDGVVAHYGEATDIGATVRFYGGGRAGAAEGADSDVARAEFARLCGGLRADHDRVDELDLSMTVFEMHWREMEFLHGHFGLFDGGPGGRPAPPVQVHLYLTVYRGAFLEVRYTAVGGAGDPSGPNSVVRSLLAQMLVRDLAPGWASAEDFRRSESTLIDVVDWLEAEPAFPPDGVRRMAAAFAMEWLSQAPYLELKVDPGPLAEALSDGDCELEPLLLLMQLLGAGRHAVQQGMADRVSDNVAGIECALRTSGNLGVTGDAPGDCAALGPLNDQARRGTLAGYYADR